MNVEIPRLSPVTYQTMHKLESYILKYNLIPTMIVGCLVGVILSGYLFYQFSRPYLFNSSATKTVLNKEEMKNLVEEIGKIAKLPQREDPSVATVTDISKLKDQPVFAESKNGDRVLLYTNAQKVVIYDPISRKIVNIAPLTAGNARAVNNTIVPSASSVPTAIPAASVQNQAKIVLRNGTAVTGLASKIEAEIKKVFPQANITNKDNALKENYEKTTVIILSESARDAAINLAKVLSGSISDLPQGETKPTGADILVIIGKDKI
ncbi:hypothetical protein A3I48_04390 [Candidatus Daviesbacteria bacterium RIFCSPLOWO2_02_FULL_36_7]|uniref:LytR/CpsA/Psr regulator C-terminal domain-containing protein n=1 Tax=Candidatus Daviesbacteria bacterium RIFCSPLOWO2_02_FULL_36_7 TaxID=1797792 RepID=A0A1F5MHL1_9BACT|nr:MAG: hypothetical protein A3I48_04390 [Candidatus Daviesbacteria bacterium RIFCSPLOWO2_02_FULL_36_7]